MHVNLQHTLFSSGSHDGRGVNKLCCDCFIYRLITVQATGKNDMPEILMRNLTQTHTLQYICHVVCAHAVMLFPSQNSPEDLYLINKESVTRNEIFQVFTLQCEHIFAAQNQFCIGVNKIKTSLVEERSVIYLRVKEKLQNIGGVDD